MGRNLGGVSICVRDFLPFHFVFVKTKNIGRRSFRWFTYCLPSAIFVYHAFIGLHEVVPQAFPSSSFFGLTSFELCCAVARQLHELPPDEWATTKQACRDESVVYLFLSSTNIYFALH